MMNRAELTNEQLLYLLAEYPPIPDTPTISVSFNNDFDEVFNVMCFIRAPCTFYVEPTGGAVSVKIDVLSGMLSHENRTLTILMLHSFGLEVWAHTKDSILTEPDLDPEHRVRSISGRDFGSIMNHRRLLQQQNSTALEIGAIMHPIAKERNLRDYIED